MYSHIVLGGTFDHLHVGHKVLINAAFSKSRKVSIGLTKASMNRSKLLSRQIQSFDLRQKAIFQYVKQLNRTSDVKIIPITDIYGETLTDTSLEAIIVTPHTLAGASEINLERKRKGLPELAIELCNLEKDSHGEIISSSRIRQGEIDRNGRNYLDFFQDDVHISPKAREFLKRPIGKAIGATFLRKSKKSIVIVGDISTEYCIHNKIHFVIAFVDGKSQQKDFTFPIEIPFRLTKLTYENKPGTISSILAKQIVTQFSQVTNMVYRINGEEDLLTVAATILLPFGTNIVYGYPFQPRSLRCITVSEKAKQRFTKLLFSIE